MRKFNIRKVLDGLTAGSSSASQQPPPQQHTPGSREPEIQETLQSEHFQLCKTVRHGFPYQPSALAFDPVQKILAVGTQTGALRLFGRPGVECYCQHDSGSAVIQLQFLINEGALVSALADDTLHLWNLRQKRPAILHSLKFCRERITFCHLPFQSKWLYVGTERGNIHIVNVESFTLSGYVIMWNKAIELSSKSHPGPIVHISDNPMDEGKLLIGFESGTVVLWDLKSKKGDYRYTYDEAIHSVAWHHEGKQFICSHSDGTLTIWNVRSPAKPVQTITPHGKQLKDGKKPEPCKPILKVEFKTSRSGSCRQGQVFNKKQLWMGSNFQAGTPLNSWEFCTTYRSLEEEPFIILSGGLSYDTVGRRPCLTVMHGKSTAVLEMDYSIVDFLTLCETPYTNDFQEPYAVVVLLEKDLVLIDLAQNGVVFGNCNGIAIVDYLQKAVLLNLGTIELYGSNDPYRREPRSPRKSRQPSGAGLCDINEGTVVPEDRCKSPTSGSSSPLNSDDEQKMNNFIEKVKTKSRKFSKMVASDIAKMSRKLSLPTDLKPDLDVKDNSFSRSRSSSVTSIDKESREAISALHFCETFTRKADSSPSPCLWVGTTLGTVLVIALNLPPGGEQRLLQPVIVSPSGTVLRLKGGILRMAFLDTTGCLVPPAYESWREHNVPEEKDEKEKLKKKRPVSVSPSSSQEINENQYAVICSEKQAKVIALPTQNCAYKQNITETSFVLRGDIVALSNSICLACFCANGHIMTFSLPSLRPLLDVYYLPLTNMRIARTFCFTNNGQALYLVSPTEIQRLTYSQETCENLQEMLGELFTPVETPEAPNRGFFKGLFGGGAQSLDREELFGESSSGKASRSLAQHIPGPGGIEGVKGAASGVVGELARARLALDERGQKLGDLEERTAAMLSSADSFSKHAHEMMLKYKDKKWYQF
ncbi:syntaxin-binding protein 5 isoform X17 [Pipistrellus kuhlii]|uniref:syntaxin-binding protein 5 isoform X17 n=1 Tax=Pipistrellus kuhlii TaxID=59472 RepID=UPI001E26EF6C|nr:syntaxin-binding protein 5 isoform X17 [Pipistrellus kuhlii]